MATSGPQYCLGNNPSVPWAFCDSNDVVRRICVTKHVAGCRFVFRPSDNYVRISFYLEQRHWIIPSVGVIALQRIFRDGSRQLPVAEGFARAVDQIDLGCGKYFGLAV